MITGRENSEIAELSSLPQFKTASCMPELNATRHRQASDSKSNPLSSCFEIKWKMPKNVRLGL